MADLGSSLQSILQVPGLQELLNSSITRQRQLEPVRTAVSQQAVNMLPNSAFSRPNIGAIAPANYSTPAPSGGTDWTKVLSLLGAGAAGGSLLSRLLGGGSRNGGGSSSGGDLGKLIQAIRQALQRNGHTFQGNKPSPGGALPSGNPGMNGFTGWPNNSFPDNTDDAGNQNGPPGPTPSVDTSYNFDNDPNLGNGGGEGMDYNNWPGGDGGGGGNGGSDYGDDQ